MAKPAKRDGRFSQLEAKIASTEREEYEGALRQIYRHAPYADFVELGLTILQFQDIRLVAANVDILGLDISVVESKLHVEMGWCDGIKEHPQYEEVKERIKAAFVKACGAKTFDQIAENAQTAVGRRLVDFAETGPARESIQALTELAARVSAKKARNDEPEDDGAKGPDSPRDLLAGFQAAFAMLGSMMGNQAVASGVSIDASKLNVPAPPKALKGEEG
jgi:hypothetical protein